VGRLGLYDSFRLSYFPIHEQYGISPGLNFLGLSGAANGCFVELANRAYVAARLYTDAVITNGFLAGVWLYCC